MITFKYKTNGGCAFPVGYKQNLGLHSAKDRGGVKEVAIDTYVYHLMCTTVCTVQSLLDIYMVCCTMLLSRHFGRYTSRLWLLWFHFNMDCLQTTDSWFHHFNRG